MLVPFSPDLPDRIQDNLIAYIRLFAGLPGIAVKDDGDTFWIVSRQGAPGDNILKARWPAQGVEERIDALFAEVGAHLDEIEWMVFPGDRPADLGSRLETRGMPGYPPGNWLWADLTHLPPAPPVPDWFRIKQVRSDQAMAEWVRASEAGFGGELPAHYPAYSRHGYGPDAFSFHYTGYLDGAPVTSATLLDAGGTAAIYDLSTLPDQRGRGAGGALTLALLEEIHRRGYSETWIWASDMARSLYKKLGFVDVDFGIRGHVWKR